MYQVITLWVCVCVCVCEILLTVNPGVGVVIDWLPWFVCDRPLCLPQGDLPCAYVDFPTDRRTQDLGPERMAVVMWLEKLSGILYILMFLKFAAIVRADRIPSLSVNDKNLFRCTPFRHSGCIAPVIVKLGTRHYTKISTELQARSFCGK